STNYRTYQMVTNNVVTGCGGDGIEFSGYTTSSSISNNSVFSNVQLWSSSSAYPASELNAFNGGIRVISATPTAADVTAITVDGNQVYGNGPDNAAVWATSPVDAGFYSLGFGIWFDTIGPGNVLSNNVTYNNVLSGIFLEKNTSVLAKYNISYGNRLDGINVQGNNTSQPSSGNMLYNNTVYGNGQRGIFLSGYYPGGAGTCVNNRIVNNISTGNGAQNLAAIYGCENDGTNGYGNVYTNNAFGPDDLNFIWWGGTYGIPSNRSTYSSWEAAPGNCGAGGCTQSVHGDPQMMS